MSTVVKTVLWITLFAASFAGARFASRPDANAAPETDANAKEVSRLSAMEGESLYEDTGTGLSAAIARLERAESTAAKKDFKNLMKGENAYASTDGWAVADPEGMWRWLQKGEGPSFGSNIYYPVFQNWFKRDPDAALDALRQTGDSGRHAGSFALLYLLFSDDSEVAQTAGERLGEFIGDSRPDPGEPSEDYFSQGREALEKLTVLPDSPTKSRLIRVTLAGWFRKDWKAAREWAASQPENERADMERFLFAQGLPLNFRRDYEAMEWANDWLGRDENRDIRARIGKEMAWGIAQQDPAEAMTWAGENLSGAPLTEAVAAVVTAQFKQDPATATAIVDALPPGGVRLQAGRALINSLRISDPLAAYERAECEQRSGFDVGRGAWGDIGHSIALKHSEDAREILTHPPDALPSSFEEKMLSELTRNDPETTLNWATQLDGERGAKIADKVLRSWRSSDPVAAQNWEESR